VLGDPELLGLFAFRPGWLCLKATRFSDPSSFPIDDADLAASSSRASLPAGRSVSPVDDLAPYVPLDLFSRRACSDLLSAHPDLADIALYETSLTECHPGIGFKQYPGPRLERLCAESRPLSCAQAGMTR